MITVQSFCKAVTEHKIDESLMKFGVAAFDIIFGGVIMSAEKAEALEPENELDLLEHIFIGKTTARVYSNTQFPGASDGELKCGIITAILQGEAAIECTLPNRPEPRRKMLILPTREPSSSKAKRLRQFLELFRKWYSPNLEENYETLEDDEFEREMLQAQRKYIEAKFLQLMQKQKELEEEEAEARYRMEERLTLQAIGEIMVFLDNLYLKPVSPLYHGGSIARKSITLDDLEVSVLGCKSFVAQDSPAREPILQKRELDFKQLGR